MATAGGGGLKKVDYVKRKERFVNETKSEMEKQLNILVEKIGYVNTVILLEAINAMEIADVYTDKDKNYKNGWFTLENEYTSNIGIFVDETLEIQERWVEVYSKICFGMK